MKRTNRILSILLGAAILFGASSCKKDDPIVEEEEGLPVGNGFYMAKVGEDPVATAVLVSEQVDGPGISGMDREGFLQGYMYLTAGNYNIVEVVDKQVEATLGGTLTPVAGADAHNAECDESGYNLVAATEGGAAFAVAADGLYVVAYDTQLSEIVYDQITSVGAIGTATPTGWGGDTEMTTTITADGLTAVAEGVTLDEDVMKFRFNCRWAIDRRLDTGKDFANDNGYSFWTNFGGQSFDNLVAGNRSDGGNLPVPEYAVYTINFAWTAADGFTASITKTGEAEPKPEYPEVMYLVGAGTAYGWDEPGTHDAAVMHTVANSKDGLFWKILYIEAGQGFKISAAAWGSPNLGFADPDSYDAEGVTVSDKDGNMDIATSGMYEVVLDLRNDETKVSIRPAVVYGIGGDGSAFNTGWASMDAATKFTVDDVAKTIYSPAIAADGTIRTYASHPWVTNADDGDWWTSEFVPNAGAIEYRNNSGNDPSSISATAGDVITYTFDDNTASID